MRPSLRRLLMPGLTAAVALAFSAGSAHALVLAPAGACSNAGSSPVFQRFLDPMNYQLVSGGSFESVPSRWALGNASIVPGGEPWDVTGLPNASALSIPSGATVRSAPVCVSLDRPTVRFFVRPPATGTSALVVTASAITSFGFPITVPVGIVASGAHSWTPTPAFPILLSTLSAASSTGASDVRLNFTPLGPGAWTIDDVYIDPFGRV